MKNNFLELQKLNIAQRAEWIAEQTNDYQIIKAYMSARIGDISLTTAQQEKLRRWQFVYDQMSTGKFLINDIRFQLIKHFGVSDSVALADLRQSQEVFSVTLNLNKRFKIQLDIQQLDIQQKKARDTNNLEAYTKLQRVKNELYKMLPDEEDELPGDYFTPRVNEIKFDPSLLGHKPTPPDKLKSLFNDLKAEFGITDIEFEIVEESKEKE